MSRGCRYDLLREKLTMDNNLRRSFKICVADHRRH